MAVMMGHTALSLSILIPLAPNNGGPAFSLTNHNISTACQLPLSLYFMKTAGKISRLIDLVERVHLFWRHLVSAEAACLSSLVTLLPSLSQFSISHLKYKLSTALGQKRISLKWCLTKMQTISYIHWPTAFFSHSFALFAIFTFNNCAPIDCCFPKSTINSQESTIGHL